METGNLADGGAAEQETGVTVDLDNPDSSKAVLRSRARPLAARTEAKDWGKERAETSKEVKKRIARLNSRFNQQLADQQAEHQREIAELRSRVDKVNTKTAEADTDEVKHQAAMDKLQADLEEAQERGDSKAVAKITREMSTLDARFWAAKTAKQTGTEQRTDQGQQRQQVDPNAPRQRQPTKAGLKWAQANAEWWNDTVDDIASDAREYANRIHKRRLAEGDGDPETAEYFEQIGEMVRKRFPEIEVKSAVRRARQEIDDAGPGDDDGDDDDDDEGTNQNRRDARRIASQSIRDRGAPNRRQDMQTLTKADQATMRSVGMNPDNDKHVLQFLRSKREEAEAQGADA